MSRRDPEKPNDPDESPSKQAKSKRAKSKRAGQRTRPTGRLSVDVTPAGAFAASALGVALLALAFSAGRYYALTAARSSGRVAQGGDSVEVTLENVHQSPSLSFDKIGIDRGAQFEGEREP
jgi:hypothetical protein